jgi:hypothetical protein
MDTQRTPRARERRSPSPIRCDPLIGTEVQSRLDSDGLMEMRQPQLQQDDATEPQLRLNEMADPQFRLNEMADPQFQSREQTESQLPPNGVMNSDSVAMMEATLTAENMPNAGQTTEAQRGPMSSAKYNGARDTIEYHRNHYQSEIRGDIQSQFLQVAMLPKLVSLKLPRVESDVNVPVGPAIKVLGDI